MLIDLGMIGAKLESVPLSPGMNYAEVCGEVLEDQYHYMRLMGRLLYLNFTRPDISYTVNHLSQFMHRPCEYHLDGAMHILAYLKGILHQGLYYDKSSSL